MRKLAYFYLFLSLLLVSCSERRTMRDLLDIESYIDARPDSALVAIRQIDTLSLNTKAQKAKFALLHAMALDKNYIDTSNTSIIMPAVDYYSEHGSPEERLKAWMYLGTQQYNAESYNQAIVSYTHASEYSKDVKDFNLLGVLFSKIADTYTITQDYSQADLFIDKSLECFRICGRIDQEQLEQLRKARSLVYLMEWRKADEYFKTLIQDSTITPPLKGYIEGDYAMMILSSPEHDDLLALEHLEEALRVNGYLKNVDQYCAWAYLLDYSGKKEESKQVLSQILPLNDTNRYSYNYWVHRIQKKNGHFKDAYYSLWEAKRNSDSIAHINYIKSASIAQRDYYEKEKLNRGLELIKSKYHKFFLILLTAIISILSAFFLWKQKHDYLEKEGRSALIIDSLKDQVKSIGSEKTVLGDQIDRLNKDNAKARLAYLATLYEVIYPYAKEGKDSYHEYKLYRSIEEKVRVLRSDPKAQKEFETILNKNSNNIMSRFRCDYPTLSENEYRMASYVFAGFDNTSIMLIMNISTLENTRAKKSRLKQRIEQSLSESKQDYLYWFES